MSAPDWQQRVLAERDELSGRLERLEQMLISPRFEFTILDATDRFLLTLQRQAMRTYRLVLDERIRRFCSANVAPESED